jgi:hypothetical protein
VLPLRSGIAHGELMVARLPIARGEPCLQGLWQRVAYLQGPRRLPVVRLIMVMGPDFIVLAMV